MTAELLTVDVAIIGAGTAGLSARREVAKETDNYRVIDPGPLGTTCARVGCMPSKALVQSANAFHRRLDFPGLGISGARLLTVDGPRVLDEVRKLRDSFTHHVLADMQKWRATHLIEGRVRFDSKGILRVNDQRLKARKTIVATGSTPRVPDKWRKRFGHSIITTDSLFELPTLPASMAVIGLGAVGAELGQALARLGVRIFAFDDSRSFGGLTDPDLQSMAWRNMAAEFSLVNEKAELAQGQDGRVRVSWRNGSTDVDCVFVAMGRESSLPALKLSKLGIELNKNGVPAFDDSTMRIRHSDLYLAGDASNERPVLHEASDEGRIAGYNAVRATDHQFTRRVPIRITFTDPEIALVGQTFTDLQRDGTEFVVGEASFENQGRARLARHTGGALRVYAAQGDGKLLGAEMFAPSAEHFAHLLAYAMEMDATLGQALQMPFYHPVYEEGVRSALRDAANKTEASWRQTDLMRCKEVPVEEVTMSR
jgi:dihydrolipoamide dehydrogenase